METGTIDRQYEDLLADIIATGQHKADRTGTGTISVFGRQLRYDLAQAFPLITTKKVFTRGIIEELLWFLRGQCNQLDLAARGVHIWDEWAGADGDLGPIYGVQWRSWPDYNGQAIDQIAGLIKDLRENPDSRRHLVSAWNVAQLDQMALQPCHVMFQCYVAAGRLSLQIYQRSCDMFLGVPFNIASYALLTHMLAQQSGLEVGELIWVGGDCHIYLNHLEQVREQLSRQPFPFPKLNLHKADSIDGYEVSDFEIEGYQCHPKISAPIAV